MTQFTRLLLIALPCLSSLGLSQELQHRVPPSPPAYTLGPGDEVVLRVAEMDEITDKPIRIDPAGFIDLPLAGRVQAAGLTPDQLKIAVSDRLSKYITTPQVSVNLAQSASQPVSVIGEVNNPGVQQLVGSKRLVDILSLSGGVKADAGPVVIVTRDPRFGTLPGQKPALDANGYSTATFSLDALLAAKNTADNIVMEPNDVISIPKAELIYVLGDVKKAGGFQLSTHPSVSVIKALALAEGLTPDNKASDARILREEPGGDGVPREIPVDIKKIEAGKAPDVPLYANDVLFIPHSGAKVTARRAVEVAIGVTTGILIYR